MARYFIPGKSFTRPPRINTTENFCKLWPPSPGICAVINFKFDNRILATLRKAEFGFLGVVTKILIQTPFFCGHFFNAGALIFHFLFFLKLRVT
jgi:hypothetical protein